MNRNRRTLRGALLAAPALLLLAGPSIAEATFTLEGPTASQDDPKPRTIPKPKPKPQDKPQGTPADKPQAKPASRPQAPGGRTLPALDKADPDYDRKVQKYARYGFGPDGKPLPGGGAKRQDNRAKGQKDARSPEKADPRGTRFEGDGKTGGKGQARPNLPKDPNALLDIAFGTDRHDFGRAEQGDVLEHIFEFKAGGSSPLQIGQASPTCGCTIGLLEVQTGEEWVPYVYGDDIAPGTSLRLNARMNTTNKRNRTEVKINVYHNDPRGTTQLALVAHVEPFLQANPPLVNFGNVPGGETVTQVFDVHSNKGEPVSLQWDELRGQRRPEGLDIKIEPVNPGPDGKASHWRVTCTANSTMKEGNFGYQISMLSDKIRPDAEEIQEQNKIRADLPETNPDGTRNAKHQQDTHHRLNVTCTGRVLGLLSHNPQFVSMGVVRPGQVVPRTVRVDVHDPNVNLDNIKVELKGDPNTGEPLAWAENFTTEVRPVPGSKSVDVELKLNGLPADAEGPFRGVISIQTGVAAKPTIDVRFSGVCRGSSGGR